MRNIDYKGIEKYTNTSENEIPNKVKAIALENKWFGIEFLYIWKGFKLFTEIQNPDDTEKDIVDIPKVILSCSKETRLASVNEVLDNIKEWFDESIRAVCTNNLNLEILNTLEKEETSEDLTQKGFLNLRLGNESDALNYLKKAAKLNETSAHLFLIQNKLPFSSTYLEITEEEFKGISYILLDVIKNETLKLKEKPCLLG